MAKPESFTELPTRVLFRETTDADCLRLAFFDNLAHRDFNPIERAIILSRLEPHVGRDGLIRDYLPLMGMKPAAAVFDRTVRLNQLIDALKRDVVEGRVEAKSAADIAGWDEADQQAFAALIERSRPSVSVAREWAEALGDLARREDRSVADILADDALRSILESDDRLPAERTAGIRRILREQRFPNLAAATDRFEAARSELGLPPSMRLEPAANFESDEMRLEVRFRDSVSLREAADRMRGWFDDPGLIDRLWPWR